MASQERRARAAKMLFKRAGRPGQIEIGNAQKDGEYYSYIQFAAVPRPALLDLLPSRFFGSAVITIFRLAVGAYVLHLPNGQHY